MELKTKIDKGSAYTFDYKIELFSNTYLLVNFGDVNDIVSFMEANDYKNKVIKTAKKLVKKHKRKKNLGFVKMNLKFGVCILHIYRIPETIFDLSVIAHEINHCVNEILDYEKTPLCSETYEIYALMAETFTNVIYNEIFDTDEKI